MGFGRGKVILLGEHAVVHGCPAIAVGIERGVTAEAKAAERDILLLAPWDLAVGPDPRGSEPLERAFAAALALYPTRPALEVNATVELPAGAGLGCSAAIGVAVLDAIDQALSIERSPGREFSMATHRGSTTPCRLLEAWLSTAEAIHFNRCVRTSLCTWWSATAASPRAPRRWSPLSRVSSKMTQSA